MRADARCQAAIIEDDQILVLKVWDHASSGDRFCVLPGGARFRGESEEECVQREVREETHLEVRVDRLILDEPALPDGMYRRIKTYTCHIVRGTAKPGIEPEIDSDGKNTIQGIEWFNLRDPDTWQELAPDDPIIYRQLQRIRAALQYAPDRS